DPLGRLVEVRLARDDRRVLAAHLDDDRLGEPSREVLVEVEPDLEAAGEDDPVDAVVLLELRADLLTGTHDQVEDPVGDAAIAHRLEEALTADRRVGAGLVDDRVAGHERATGWSTG